MARIVKKGRLRPPVYRGTCKDCGCVIEEENLSKLTILSSVRGTFANFKCLQCKSNMYLYPHIAERENDDE